MEGSIAHARAVASAYLAERGYADEARLVAEGQGDDFAEVRLALKLMVKRDDRARHYALALDYYADGREDDGLRARLALSGQSMPIDSVD